MTRASELGPYQPTYGLPPHLAEWQLPPGWSWGMQGVMGEYRHYQEIIDALGRSLSLVTAPDPAHAAWLFHEARRLAHRSHPSIPTTYHYWASFQQNRRGPGYLRRWIAGETLEARRRRLGAEDLPYVLQVLRSTGSMLAYLHDAGSVHGAVSPHTVWVTPTGRLFLIGWQWALARNEIPPDVAPLRVHMPAPPEWRAEWTPSPASDQWQLAACCFAMLAGEPPPPEDVPPVRLVRPECPLSVAAVLDRALDPRPERRFPSMAALLRALDSGRVRRTMVMTDDEIAEQPPTDSEETRVRWATGDDYEVLSALGSGMFGSVWRVRDLTLEREVALKVLHPSVARSDTALARFRREARLAAQLAHPVIVPIYDWDSRGEVAWYTMELAEGGSVADLVAHAGPRSLEEIAPQIEAVLDALAVAHANGIVHRDLKPENILIDRYRRWRLTDFGIANVAGEDRGTTTGTPAFAAPEQLLGEPQGPAADCFAMAAIVVFVLSGQPPFGERDRRVILARELTGRLDLSTYPPEIAAWIRIGLDADPEQRFPDAAAMLTVWRGAVEAVLHPERRLGWWRRLLGDESTIPSLSAPVPPPA